MGEFLVSTVYGPHHCTALHQWSGILHGLPHMASFSLSAFLAAAVAEDAMAAGNAAGDSAREGHTKWALLKLLRVIAHCWLQV